jgi:hypothetical protein
VSKRAQVGSRKKREAAGEREAALVSIENQAGARNPGNWNFKARRFCLFVLKVAYFFSFREKKRTQ